MSDVEVMDPEEDEEEGRKRVPPNQRTEDVIHALDLVRDVLVGGGRLDHRAQEAFSKILRNHANRIQAGLVAIGLQRFGQLAILTKNMGDIEGEVGRRVEEGLIKVASTKDLAILYRAFADREKSLIAFLSIIGEGGMPDKLTDSMDMRDIEEDLSDKGIKGIPKPESRERVMALIKKIAAERG